mgnify:CR=1 FL=1
MFPHLLFHLTCVCSAQADNTSHDSFNPGPRCVEASLLSKTIGFRQVVDAHAQEEFGQEEESVPEPTQRPTRSKKARNQGPRWHR